MKRANKGEWSTQDLDRRRPVSPRLEEALGDGVPNKATRKDIFNHCKNHSDETERKGKTCLDLCPPYSKPNWKPESEPPSPTYTHTIQYIGARPMGTEQGREGWRRNRTAGLGGRGDAEETNEWAMYTLSKMLSIWLGILPFPFNQLWPRG